MLGSFFYTYFSPDTKVALLLIIRSGYLFLEYEVGKKAPICNTLSPYVNQSHTPSPSPTFFEGVGGHTVQIDFEWIP